MLTFSRIRSIFFTEASLGSFFRCGGRNFPERFRAIFMPHAGRAETTESKRLLGKVRASTGLPASAGGMKVSRCRTLWKARGSRTAPHVLESRPVNRLLEIPASNGRNLERKGARER